jgi:ferredoxin
MGALEIVIDRDACRGSQSCVRRAPRSFSLDAEGKARAVSPPLDPEQDVRAAASACPFFAIEVRSTAGEAG